MTKYFKSEENRETISKETFKEDQALVSRRHVYKTGATYFGQWKGGLRHGKGVMTWPDGAKYDGSWNLN
jgi:hypothetical protein